MLHANTLNHQCCLYETVLTSFCLNSWNNIWGIFCVITFLFEYIVAISQYLKTVIHILQYFCLQNITSNQFFVFFFFSLFFMCFYYVFFNVLKSSILPSMWSVNGLHVQVDTDKSTDPHTIWGCSCHNNNNNNMSINMHARLCLLEVILFMKGNIFFQQKKTWHSITVHLQLRLQQNIARDYFIVS